MSSVMDHAAFTVLMRESADILAGSLRRMQSDRMRDQMFFRVRELQGLPPFSVKLKIWRPTAYVKTSSTWPNPKTGEPGEFRVDVLFDGVQT